MKLLAMERTSLWVPIIAFQIFMFLAKESLAIQCYRCSGDGTTTDCNDPFNPNMIGVTKCEGKTCTKGKSEYAGENIVMALPLFYKLLVY